MLVPMKTFEMECLLGTIHLVRTQNVPKCSEMFSYPYAPAHVPISGLEMLVFRKILLTYQMDNNYLFTC